MHEFCMFCFIQMLNWHVWDLTRDYRPQALMAVSFASFALMPSCRDAIHSRAMLRISAADLVHLVLPKLRTWFFFPNLARIPIVFFPFVE